MMDVPTEHCQKHYEEHKERPFFNKLVKYVCSGPVVAMCLEGTKAVEGSRNVIGVIMNLILTFRQQIQLLLLQELFVEIWLWKWEEILSMDLIL